MPLLCDYFLERFALDLGVRNPGLAEETYPILVNHSWPGNVRELANLMEQCLIFSRGQRVAPKTVEQLLQGIEKQSSDDSRKFDAALAEELRLALADGNRNLLESITTRVVRQTIEEALRHTGGNRSQAARLLGVSRPTLLAKMRKHGLR